jgi:hypothetical protein
MIIFDIRTESLTSADKLHRKFPDDLFTIFEPITSENEKFLYIWGENSDYTQNRSQAILHIYVKETGKWQEDGRDVSKFHSSGCIIF